MCLDYFVDNKSSHNCFIVIIYYYYGAGQSVWKMYLISVDVKVHNQMSGRGVSVNMLNVQYSD